jgi:hypothetical protein
VHGEDRGDDEARSKYQGLGLSSVDVQVVPTQLVENQIPPDPFHSVMPMVSLLPGVP